MTLLSDRTNEMQMEIEMLQAENALKLTQILGLEELLWSLHTPGWDDPDGSPCWCGNFIHSDECMQARKATEPFWMKQRE